METPRWPSLRRLSSSSSSSSSSSYNHHHHHNTTTDPLLLEAKSQILRIRSRNLAGVVSDQGSDVWIDLTTTITTTITNQLIAVTGETGSGKSLLISKVGDLLTGGKVSASLIGKASPDHTATVEMVLQLCQPEQVALCHRTLVRFGMDPTSIFPNNVDNNNNNNNNNIPLPLTLTLERTLTLPSTSGGQQRRQRIQSLCFLNHQPIPLKVLRAIAAPLVAVVNAPAAGAALAKAPLRLAMLDTAVAGRCRRRVRVAQSHYQHCRTERTRLQDDLDARTLPKSLTMTTTNGDPEDLELLRHWIQELDGFEGRMRSVCEMVAAGSSLLHDGSISLSSSGLGNLLDEFASLDWMDNEFHEPSRGFSSKLYHKLQTLADELKTTDGKLEAAQLARDSLASLSAKDSAMTALERTRGYLLDAAEAGNSNADNNNNNNNNNNKLFVASERAHELLNQVEDALSECASFLDDDEKGLLALLQQQRDACRLSSEDVMEYLSEWKTLARKHGIAPQLLPSCHRSLRQELDGNVEARTLLPAAIEAEEAALKELQKECKVLSQSRQEISDRLSQSISQRLPFLGMENSRFEVRLRQKEHPTYVSGLGVDEVDFYLFHDNAKSGEITSGTSQRGGKVEQVASSGEKARILLAIECEIPGSMRALCGTTSTEDDEEEEATHKPIAVIYDEIDAHVGGRASVSVAQMLSAQSERCQVVSITHSPSVAALADLHICIQKENDRNGLPLVSAERVEDSRRRKELARMASGDMAVDEAEVFAEALIRDAKTTKGFGMQ